MHFEDASQSFPMPAGMWRMYFAQHKPGNIQAIFIIEFLHSYLRLILGCALIKARWRLSS